MSNGKHCSGGTRQCSTVSIGCNRNNNNCGNGYPSGRNGTSGYGSGGSSSSSSSNSSTKIPPPNSCCWSTVSNAKKYDEKYDFLKGSSNFIGSGRTYKDLVVNANRPIKLKSAWLMGWIDKWKLKGINFTDAYRYNSTNTIIEFNDTAVRIDHVDNIYLNEWSTAQERASIRQLADILVSSDVRSPCGLPNLDDTYFNCIHRVLTILNSINPR